MPRSMLQHQLMLMLMLMLMLHSMMSSHCLLLEMKISSKSFLFHNEPIILTQLTINRGPKEQNQNESSQTKSECDETNNNRDNSSHAACTRSCGHFSVIVSVMSAKRKRETNQWKFVYQKIYFSRPLILTFPWRLSAFLPAWLGSSRWKSWSKISDLDIKLIHDDWKICDDVFDESWRITFEAINESGLEFCDVLFEICLSDGIFVSVCSIRTTCGWCPCCFSLSSECIVPDEIDVISSFGTPARNPADTDDFFIDVTVAPRAIWVPVWWSSSSSSDVDVLCVIEEICFFDGADIDVRDEICWLVDIVLFVPAIRVTTVCERSSFSCWFSLCPSCFFCTFCRSCCSCVKNCF